MQTQIRLSLSQSSLILHESEKSERCFYAKAAWSSSVEKTKWRDNIVFTFQGTKRVVELALPFSVATNIRDM